MGLFSNENEKIKSGTKKNSEEYYSRLERKLESHRKVFDEYKTLLRKYEERIISEYRDSLDIYNNNISSFIEKLEKYEEKIQWYEEQQDVYAKKAKNEIELLTGQVMDIKDMKEQINRLRIQLEDMKEKQVDHIAEDLQILLAKQTDIQKQIGDVDFKIAFEVITAKYESTISRLETSVNDVLASNEELKRENKATHASLRFILWINVIMFGGIAGALFLLFQY